MSNVFFIDGFDYRNNAASGGVWTKDGGALCALASARNGIGQGCSLSKENIFRSFAGPDFVIPGESLTVGLAFNQSTLSSSLSIQVGSNVNANTACEMRLAFNVAGQILLKDGSNNIVRIYSFAQPLQPNTWYYIEWRLKLSTSVAGEGGLNGESEIWLDSQALTADGEADQIVTGIKTRRDQTNGALYYSSFQLLNDNFPSVFIDDLYIGNSHAGNNTLPLGDSVVRTVYPNGAGVNTALVSSSGNANYLNVQGQPPGQPQATPYNSSATDGEYDVYAMTDIVIPVGGAIYAVQANPAVVLSASGTKGYKHMLHNGATDAEGPRLSGSTSILYGPKLYEEDPDSAAAWDETTFNSAQFGIKVST